MSLNDSFKVLTYVFGLTQRLLISITIILMQSCVLLTLWEVSYDS